MKPISVLFYVEPVMYHNNPAHLEAWVTMVARFCHFSSSHIQASFVSSPWLCRKLAEHEGVSRCQRIGIIPRGILAPFAFDRHAYGADLYRARHDPEKNQPLATALRSIADTVRPDVVVCFTQNRYIESVFAKQRTLFCEMGAIPRIAGRPSIFLDPSGHQTASLLNIAADRIRSLPLDAKTVAAVDRQWQQHFVEPARQHPLTHAWAEWLERASGGRKVALLAVQTPDWLTYEAAYGVVPIDNLIMRWLQDLPDGWAAVPTYHPHYTMPRLAEEAIASDFPSLLLPPAELMAATWESLPPWTGLSELLLPLVDGVVTLSSSVGIHGLLYGKSVVAYGQSSLRSLAGRTLTSNPTMNETERARLLAFLSHRYCHPYDDCMDRAGYLGDVLTRYAQAENPLDTFFDFGNWSPERIATFTAAAKPAV